MSAVEKLHDTGKSPQKYAVREDEFSFQLSMPADPRFWLRIETGLSSISITDFMLGQQNRKTQGEALLFGLKQVGLGPDICKIVFKDIHAGREASDDLSRSVATDYAAMLVPILSDQGLRVEGVEFDKYRGKVSVEFRIS